jgi:hypothetical protein
MSRPLWKVVWTLSLVICAVLRASAQAGAPTGDRPALDVDTRRHQSGLRNVRIASRKASPKSAAFRAPTP